MAKAEARFESRWASGWLARTPVYAVTSTCFTTVARHSSIK